MGTPIVRLLLIEDDQVDRLACRRALSRLTDSVFDIHETDLARDGLAYARAHHLDLILLDYRLPDLNGVEVLSELRMFEEAPPVIMMTGAGDISVAVEAMRSGACDYLLKDTAGEYLALLPTVIERALREQQMRTEKRCMEEALRLERDFISTVLATVGAVVAARLLWYATEGPERAAYIGVGWGLVAVAFSGPSMYPWYLTWGLFAAAVGSRTRGRLALLGLSVAYALLGAWGGGGAHDIGMLVMVGAFAVTGLVVWRTSRHLVAQDDPAPALTSVTV